MLEVTFTNGQQVAINGATSDDVMFVQDHIRIGGCVLPSRNVQMILPVHDEEEEKGSLGFANHSEQQATSKHEGLHKAVVCVQKR